LVLEQNILRPSGKHRHEFSAILERILALYLQCATPKTTQQLFTNQVSGDLLQLMNHFQLELNHRQCDLAVQIAAREGLWDQAAELYTSHIDPDQGGYTPVTKTCMTETIRGLYCIARAAANSLPVEKVFEGVLSLSLVSSYDTEKCK